ncbi:MAG: extracellular solute-binding protein [Flaviflexus sp.]|nr:extracellular solute-binding protein [Flaviflexus sp.]
MLRIRKMVAAFAATALIGLGACSSDDKAEGEQTGEDVTITVWSLESLPDRMKVTEDIIDGFTEKTGIEVELVGVEEAQVPQLLQSSGLSGDLPDVVAAMPLGLIHEMNNLEMVDTDAVASIIEDLDPATFQEQAVELLKADDKHIGVPADGWSQILLYRTDHFEEAGLNPPTDFDSLAAAAQKLTEGDHFGITLATDPADVFTQQTFEALALGNNCQVVDESGAATINSAECLSVFEVYNTLGENSPAGAQTVDSTRAAYFNGSASMVMWSTYILDELAGLRDDALPSCDECKDDPGFLAEHTGVVVDIAGPAGGSATGSYGEITGFVPVKDGQAEATEQFIEYMMTEGYEQWLSMAPEGKFPMRTGTADEPEKYSDAWAQMDTGVDRKAPLGDYYSEDVIDTLTAMGENVNRWALPQGQGSLLGSLTAELPLSKAVSDMVAGSLTPQQAADEVAAAVEDMAK